MFRVGLIKTWVVDGAFEGNTEARYVTLRVDIRNRKILLSQIRLKCMAGYVLNIEFIT